MSANDYIKFLTQQFVMYTNVPKNQRKEQKQMKKENKQPFMSTWFGVVPFALRMLIKRK
ncbi:YqzE family protein [Bacillus sp. MUM 13]|uniref:YqzE family protein n=1 Tax=Bacillus sp. MUM 13 TaxID=1678001 RepID=UPI0008F5CAF2|nr:YqzE family protein [Bacillus sp. MUM 13]OIK13765.1 YqzE family protein [Bacillus sp. MUM 13]